MNENEMVGKNPTPINIKNFRNLKDLKFEFFEGKMNIILGKNNVGKSNLLDYINSWYIKNDKNSTHEIFYLKDGERFTKHLSSPIIFEVKKVLLLSAKENKEKNLILRSFECNEHHYFEIESSIFGIKRSIVLTKCRRSLMLCSLKDYKELCWNERKSDYLESPILISELETVLKEGIFFLFDEILKNVKVLSSQRFYGLGELLTYKEKSKPEGFYFKFGFSFLDPWDGKKKSLGLGTEKIIFLNLLLSTLQSEEKLLALSTENDRKWRHKNWIFSFLPSSRQKTVLLIDKPETSLHPSYEREVFLSLKRLTEERNNCDVIMVTNSSECLVSFPFEIYDGSLNVAILDELGKIVYLNKVIERIKKPIIETCVEYGKLFENH